ncbi:MAG TPA: hypothetical protein VIZ32_01690, partial [Vicinamibacterales bacterium]
ELGWVSGAKPRRRGISKDPLLAKMEAGEAYGFDQLVELSGLSAAKLLTKLMELELLGEVVAAPGGRFTRSASGNVG